MLDNSVKTKIPLVPKPLVIVPKDWTNPKVYDELENGLNKNIVAFPPLASVVWLLISLEKFVSLVSLPSPKTPPVSNSKTASSYCDEVTTLPLLFINLNSNQSTEANSVLVKVIL